jgi:hypothetical protein
MAPMLAVVAAGAALCKKSRYGTTRQQRRKRRLFQINADAKYIHNPERK